MSSADNLEVEVKFHIRDANALAERLRALGATLTIPRVFERNVRYDNAWEGLRRKGQLLRLRQDNGARITFKASVPQPAGSEVKTREELELSIDDFATADAILQRIGFSPVQIYEKYRTTYQLNGLEIVLDELPYGLFVELEGAEPDIKATAAQLGLQWERRVLSNYLYLMAQLKAQQNLPFDDLTFANFSGLAAHIGVIIPAGDTPTA